MNAKPRFFHNMVLPRIHCIVKITLHINKWHRSGKAWESAGNICVHFMEFAGCCARGWFACEAGVNLLSLGCGWAVAAETKAPETAYILHRLCFFIENGIH